MSRDANGCISYPASVSIYCVGVGQPRVGKSSFPRITMEQRQLTGIVMLETDSEMAEAIRLCQVHKKFRCSAKVLGRPKGQTVRFSRVIHHCKDECQP